MSHVEPPWLRTLLTAKFFNACITHEEARNNDTNFYCLDCLTTLCQHCLSLHNSSHRVLQIRRYMYHYVIRLDAASQLMDCSSVQPYTTNGAKVVFLNQRRKTAQQQTKNRVSGNACRTCHKNVQDPFLFCSLSCKIYYMLKTEGGLSGFLRQCSFLALLEDNALMSPDTVLEPAVSGRISSGSVGSSGALACTATTTIRFAARKKRTAVPVKAPSRSTADEPRVADVGGRLSQPRALNQRKKTIPHRAPLL